MSKDDQDSVQNGILGDINPTEAAKDHMGGPSGSGTETEQRNEDKSSIIGGTESGGTRNYHQGGGVSGGDIGNRPE
jgi:hypothetical protein